jgi:hypothetical protein
MQLQNVECILQNQSDRFGPEADSELRPIVDADGEGRSLSQQFI